jgi:hypothetical protein
MTSDSVDDDEWGEPGEDEAPTVVEFLEDPTHGAACAGAFIIVLLALLYIRRNDPPRWMG